MTRVPLVSFAGLKHTGKTTLITRLVQAYAERGLQVGCIKHHGHDFAGPAASTDTGKYLLAGAAATIVASQSGHLLVERRQQDALALEALIPLLGPVDLIIVEGFKELPIPKWVLLAAKDDEGVYHTPDQLRNPEVFRHVQGFIVPKPPLAVADTGLPVYHRDNILGLLHALDRMMGI